MRTKLSAATWERSVSSTIFAREGKQEKAKAGSRGLWASAAELKEFQTKHARPPFIAATFQPGAEG